MVVPLSAQSLAESVGDPFGSDTSFDCSPKLRHLLEGELDSEVVRILAHGGSSAIVLEIKNRNNARQVLKYMEHKSGLVDGHDLATFRAKTRQIEKVRREAPGLRPYYVEVKRHIDGDDWAAVTMPLYPGTDLAYPLRQAAGDVDLFLADVGRVVSTIANHGYAISSRVASSAEVHSTHLMRVLRRSHFFDEYLPHDLARADVVINDVLCRTPEVLVRQIGNNDIWMTALTPERLCFPVHGDLNTRNLLVDRSAFVIVDPRGTTAHWDAVYDLSKLLFSLTTWDLSLRDGFSVQQSVDVTGHLNYRSQVRCPLRAYERAAEIFPSFVADHPDLLPIIGSRSTVVLRLLFAHAVDMIAEAACRLSDTRQRHGQVGDVSPFELAMGHYLLGRLLLEDVVRSLEQRREIDVSEHLQLLRGVPDLVSL